MAQDLAQGGFGFGGKRVQATVMFCDIRGFTSIVESQGPEETIELLNSWYTLMFEAIRSQGGVVNQMIGDGLMAIFGMRTTPQRACTQALLAARLMGERMDEMNRALAGDLAEPIAIGIGIHAGDAILGEIGYRDHHVLTAIGDAVHVAARLQDACKDYACTLVVSQVVADTAQADLGDRPQHDIAVRGRAEGMRIRAVRDLSTLAGVTSS